MAEKMKLDENITSIILNSLIGNLGSMHQFIGILMVITILLTIFFLVIMRNNVYKITLVLLFLGISGFLFYKFFHHTTSIPLSAKIDNSSGKLKCKHGDIRCDLESGNMECGGFEESNSSEYSCDYDDRIHSKFSYDGGTPTLPIDKIIYEIDDLKLSFDKNKLSASFGLRSPLTGNMVSIADPNISISICGESCVASRNLNSTYSASANWSKIETLARKNCGKSVCICLDDKKCSSDQKFDTIHIPFDQKDIVLKDNAYVFYGKTKQNAFSIPIDKKNFDIKMDATIKKPATCFTLTIGRNIMKVENNRVKLNEQTVEIIELDEKQPIHFQIQKPGDTITVNVFQNDSSKVNVVIDDTATFNSSIQFGYSRVSKLKEEVLSVKVVAIEDIRPN